MLKKNDLKCPETLEANPTNHCRIGREELNELSDTIIKIKQDDGAKNINSCARFLRYLRE